MKSWKAESGGVVVNDVSWTGAAHDIEILYNDSLNAAVIDRRRTHDLENSRYRFGRDDAARVGQELAAAAATRYDDVPSLIRFHEALLVLRAFPPSPAVLRRSRTASLVHSGKRVERLRKSGADMDEFDPLEVSGIAGTTMQDALGFDLARWLVKRLPGKVEIAWDDFDDERAMGAVWPRLMPLLEEDTLAEANIPWRKVAGVGARQQQ